MHYKRLLYLFIAAFVILFGVTAAVFSQNLIHFPVRVHDFTSSYEGTLSPGLSFMVITNANNVVKLSAMRECGDFQPDGGVCQNEDIFLRGEDLWPGDHGISSSWNEDGSTTAFNTYTRNFSGIHIIELQHGDAVEFWLQSEEKFEVWGTISISAQIAKASYYTMMFFMIMAFAAGMFYGDIRLPGGAKRKRT